LETVDEVNLVEIQVMEEIEEEKMVEIDQNSPNSTVAVHNIKQSNLSDKIVRQILLDTVFSLELKSLTDGNLSERKGKEGNNCEFVANILSDILKAVVTEKVVHDGSDKGNVFMDLAEASKEDLKDKRKGDCKNNLIERLEENLNENSQNVLNENSQHISSKNSKNYLIVNFNDNLSNENEDNSKETDGNDGGKKKEEKKLSKQHMKLKKESQKEILNMSSAAKRRLKIEKERKRTKEANKTETAKKYGKSKDPSRVEGENSGKGTPKLKRSQSMLKLAAK